MKKITLLFALLLCFGVQAVQAQRVVSGKVVSSDEPNGLPFVQVMVKGTTTGTTTDFNGNYSIRVTEGATLVFQFTGKKTQEIPVGTSSTIDVTMESTVKELETVTIVSDGYGVQRKAGVGATTQVGGAAIKEQNQVNVANALQGTTPGLQVGSTSGAPGSSTNVRLRGLSSMGASGTQPLYVIDGVPISAGNPANVRSDMSTDPLSLIAPEDIESISVLKDAAATSIYGSRASNGVILITTKKGKSGQSSLQFSGKIGAVTSPYISHKNRMISEEDYRNLFIEGYKNANPISGNDRHQTTTQDAINALTMQRYDDDNGGKRLFWPDEGAGADWWDEVTQIGLTQDYNLTASGGSENTSFFISGGYTNQEGYVIGTNYERYTARANVDHKAKEWLDLGINLNGAYSVQDGVNGSAFLNNPVLLARFANPTKPVTDPTGEYVFDVAPSPARGFNPVALYQSEYPDMDETMQYKAIISPYLTIKFTPDLIFKTKLGVDLTTVKTNNIMSQVVDPNVQAIGGSSSRSDLTTTNFIITNTLNWFTALGAGEKSKRPHNLNLMIGQEAQSITEYFTRSTGYEFARPDITEISAAARTQGSSEQTWVTLASYFTKAEYDYKDLYYLSASLRVDGSSRIGVENRWGTFYSFGAKYRISQEKFMESFKGQWLDNLSLRLSYGTTGNQDIGEYRARSMTAFTATYNTEPGSFPASSGNPYLKWESKNKFNVGFEASMFDRLTWELDFYDEFTKDNLAEYPLSRATGFASMIDNVGKMRNTGIETQVNVTLIKAVKPQDFRWMFGFNLSANRNRVLELPDGKAYFTANGILLREEGRAWTTLHLLDYAGADPDNGRARFYDSVGGYTYNPDSARYKLIATDPKFYGGFNTRMDYKGFDLTLTWFYSVGNKFLSTEAYYLEQYMQIAGFPTVYYYYDNRWKNPGDETQCPKFTYQSQDKGATAMNSTRSLINGNYLRFKTLILGYTLPRDFVKKASLSNVRAYFMMDNIFQITAKDFRGFDPDAALSAGQTMPLPTPRSFVFGVNVNF